MIVNDIEFKKIGKNLFGIISPELIVSYGRNPRKNDAAIPAVKRSIKKFGHLQPLVVISGNHPAAGCDESEFEIIVGHTRYKAAAELNYGPVPCILADHLSTDEVKAYRIADNQTGNIAEWDKDLLGAELAELNDMAFDMTILGFDASELDDLMGIVPDFGPAPIDDQGRLDVKDPVQCPECGHEFIP